MLIKCKECSREISDSAAACPHCGCPLSASPTANVGAKKRRATPIFLILAAVILFLSLWVPRLVIIVPVVACVALAGVSLFRRERAPAAAVIVIVLAFGLMVMSGTDMSRSSSTANLSSAKISDWSWEADPTFGTKGTIKWKVEVQNLTGKAIESAKVEFASYDESGHLLASTFTYVESIPPFQSRSDESFADYYGTEKTAHVALAEVRFAGE